MAKNNKAQGPTYTPEELADPALVRITRPMLGEVDKPAPPVAEESTVFDDVDFLDETKETDRSVDEGTVTSTGNTVEGTASVELGGPKVGN